MSRRQSVATMGNANFDISLQTGPATHVSGANGLEFMCRMDGKKVLAFTDDSANQAEQLLVELLELVAKLIQFLLDAPAYSRTLPLDPIIIIVPVNDVKA